MCPSALVLVLSVGMLALPDGMTAPRAEYEAMASKAGRDPDAHAKLALWCEAHGLDAERAKHLGMAVLTDPTNTLARSLLGLVQDGGKWRRPEQIVDRNAGDPQRQALLEDYHTRRAVAENTADAQAKLGAWCESKGLTLESQAHYAMALRLDPNRADIWKKLGYSKYKGEWRTDAMIAAEKAEAKAQEEADRRWTKQLQTWKEMLGQTEGRRREAEAGLATVDDPRAVGSVLKVFAKDNPALAVQVLGQIDTAAASRALALAAVFASSGEVRRAASETLTQRDPREYAGYLISLIRNPIRYEVKPVGGPGSPGELWVEGKKVDVKRIYAPPPPPQIALMPGDRISYDAFGLPVIRRPVQLPASASKQIYMDSLPERVGVSAPDPRFVEQVAALPGGQALAGALAQARGNIEGTALTPTAFAEMQYRLLGRPDPSNPRAVPFVDVLIPVGQAMVEAQRAAAGAQNQLQRDVAAIALYNAPIEALNLRIQPLLEQAAGRNMGPRQEQWEDWLADQLGYRLPRDPSYKPTVTQNIPLDYTPAPPIPEQSKPYAVISRHSCFAAGTLVWTQGGYRAIETLEVGDQVLSRDTTTGAQSYQPVLVVHHNPPSPTFRVAFEGHEPVTTSPNHRFWKANRGWVMARELKPGDVLRTQSGLARVAEIQEGEVQPVFNLEVAHSHSYYVGKQGALVHDNSLPDTRLTPFDRLPEIAQNAP